MSDFIKAEWAGWSDKIKFIEKVTGDELENIYNEFNLSDNKHIIATNIFPLRDLPPVPPIFCCFIFYKYKYGNIKGLE